MLLGVTSTKNREHDSQNSDFICRLINGDRYAEAYELLQAEPADDPCTQFNLALCHFWVESYREALMCLDKAQMLLTVNTGKPNFTSDGFYKAIRNKQNQFDDHKQPISPKHAMLFAATVADAILRLKTDCWLQLKDYARVINTATPIASKSYDNITEALNIARQNS